MILVHWSDTHLGEESANAARLHGLVRQACARHDAGELLCVILSGDLTHNGHAREWAALRLALAPLHARGIPVYGVLGNHDCGPLGIDYDSDTADASRTQLLKTITPPISTTRGLMVWTTPGVKIIGLDSQRGQRGEILPSLARGEIGTDQLAALEVELQDALPTLLVLHHHPLWSEWAHVLEDADQLLAILARRPQVTHVLYGHRHQSQVQHVGSTCYVASGKTTEAKAGALHQRELHLETGELIDVCYSLYQLQPAP